MIDTHAHIYLEQFNKDLEEVINRSRELGVDHVFMPNIDSSTIDDMFEVEEQYRDYCTAMMGLHPCSVKKNFEKELYLVEKWLDQRTFAAIGEIGIDLYWDTTTLIYQQEAFRIQVNWANDKKMPLVIHCRESLDQTLDLLEPLAQPDTTGVFHCFTGNQQQADRIIALGFKLGIGGVVTFKNSGLDQTLKDIPLEHLVMETDSPYLAPVPHRGKRNEPGYLPHILNKLGDIYDKPPEEVEEITTEHAGELFKKSS